MFPMICRSKTRSKDPNAGSMLLLSWCWMVIMIGAGTAAAALDHKQTLKTGTTIAGVVCRDAVVLAADTRSTMGAIVADKNCEKIHKIAPYIFCCGAGTAAHAERITLSAKMWLRLERMKSIMSASEFDESSLRSTSRSSSRVVAAATGISRVLSQQAELSAAFVLGGWDPTGPSLYQIDSDGTAQKVRFTAMGSGSFAAMSMLEARYRANLTTTEGIRLLKDAITSGILNDLGSGSNVDLCVIRREAVDHRRSVVVMPGHDGSGREAQGAGAGERASGDGSGGGGVDATRPRPPSPSFLKAGLGGKGAAAVGGRRRRRRKGGAVVEEEEDCRRRGLSLTTTAATVPRRRSQNSGATSSLLPSSSSSLEGGVEGEGRDTTAAAVRLRTYVADEPDEEIRMM